MSRMRNFNMRDPCVDNSDGADEDSANNAMIADNGVSVDNAMIAQVSLNL